MSLLDGLELSKQIRMNYPNIYIIILSGYDNFDYVKTGFQYGVFEYILKPKLTAEILFETLYKICSKLGIEDRYESNFVKYALSDQENKEMPEKYKGKYISSIAINLNKILGYSDDKYHFYYENIYEKLNKSFQDCILESYLASDNILIFVFVFEYKTKLEFVEELSRFMLDNFNQLLGIKFFYTNILNDDTILKELLNLYHSAKQHFFVPNDMLLIQSFQAEKTATPILNEFKKRAEFYDEAIEFLCEALRTTTYKLGYDEEEYKKQIEYILYITFEQKNYEDADMDMFKVMRLLSQVYSLEDLIKFVDNIFEELTPNSAKNSEDNLIDKIQEYIKNNASEQLTMKQVADRFHISYSYLSTFFSYNLGIGFNEYTNKIRIKNAKNLLKNSDLSISEICEKTGYLDHSYFSRTFKKITGVSPSAYRRDGSL